MVVWLLCGVGGVILTGGLVHFDQVLADVTLCSGHHGRRVLSVDPFPDDAARRHVHHSTDKVHRIPKIRVWGRERANEPLYR